MTQTFILYAIIRDWLFDSPSTCKCLQILNWCRTYLINITSNLLIQLSRCFEWFLGHWLLRCHSSYVFACRPKSKEPTLYDILAFKNVLRSLIQCILGFFHPCNVLDSRHLLLYVLLATDALGKHLILHISKNKEDLKSASDWDAHSELMV